MDSKEDRQKALSELKKVLTSLVCSNPSRMDVNCLRRDYAQFEKDPAIPVHKFGYRDIITFLYKECSDIFIFEGNKHNPSLKPIVTENLAAINDMVCKQKIAPGKNHMPKRSWGVYQQTPQSKPSNNPPEHTSARPYNRQQERPHTSARYEERPVKNEVIKEEAQSVPSSRNPKLSPKLISSLSALIKEYPKGLWCRELMSTYEKKYNMDLEMDRLGYCSIINLCRDLPQVFKIVRPDSLGDWRIFPLDAVIPDEFKDNSVLSDKYKRRDVEEQKLTDVEMDIFGMAALPGYGFDSSLYPENCARFGDVIPKFTEISSRVQLLVTEVRDPSHFWFQVDNEECTMALDDLMDKMDDVYHKKPPEYVMVRAAARVGQLCAVPYQDRYHRAIVVKNMSYDVVKVLYLDYGSVADIQFSEVRLLRKEFTKLPIQAHRGRLLDVRPSNNLWGSHVSSFFLQLVSDVQLNSEIVKKDPKTGIYNLKLYKFNGASREYMSDALISEGLAVSDKCPLPGATVSNKKHLVYLSSKFLMDFEEASSGSEHDDARSVIIKPKLKFLKKMRNRHSEDVASHVSSFMDSSWFTFNNRHIDEDEITPLDSVSQVGNNIYRCRNGN